MIEETISIENASFPLEASLYGRDFGMKNLLSLRLRRV